MESTFSASSIYKHYLLVCLTIPVHTDILTPYPALERTFLAYNRTANTLAAHAIGVTQLWVLHEGRRTVGTVCGAVMICGGIVISLTGCVRFLIQSRALNERLTAQELRRGHIRSSAGPSGRNAAVTAGPYVCVLAIVFGLVCIGLFVLILVLA